ncbi:kinesin-like protein KIN-14U [Impatiens glandulifera]|uniref:kinesin-like protein KIN-14U n=1 Tax=Impatiens glandulifera TaxID=253017 RepID=UPI001FB0B946|nr:kinesin-like protein KIN-14U [Impatiens glandulifera]
MLISPEKEQISISMPCQSGEEPLESSCLDSNKDCSNVVLLAPEIPISLPAYTDVNMVPEHEEDKLQQTISKLEEEIEELRLELTSLDKKRRDALNKILDIKGCIRVFCRIRPILLPNKRGEIHQSISLESDKVVVRCAGIRKEFDFDKVFPPKSTQEEVFVEVEPIVRSALDGHNVCILAYGQTSTGKTFTMNGTENKAGIVPRALEELFRQASSTAAGSFSFTFSIGMMEVYLGNLRDLLAAPKPSMRANGTISRSNLNIQTDPKGLVEIEGLTDVEISSVTKAVWWYNKGRRVRSTSWTNVNETSSRSHCLTRITISRRGDASIGKEEEVSKLWLVDLGGSERVLKTRATGQTLDEGRAINLSLSALGDVIAALRRKRAHIPYRNSRLTQILKDSLGDGSKVLMIVHVSQSEEDVGETTCSLAFATRARAVENRDLPEDLKKQKEKRIGELEQTLRNTEEQLRNVGIEKQKAEFLLREKRNILTTMYCKPLENDDEVKQEVICLLTTPTTTLVEKTAKISKSNNCIPRFMNSTMASRQRLNAGQVERQIGEKITRTWGGRSSVQLSGSQSMSYSDPHQFRTLLRNPKKKSRYGGLMEARLVDNPAPGAMESFNSSNSTKCNVKEEYRLVAAAASHGKTVTSDVNLKAPIGRHRRRMSNLI